MAQRRLQKELADLQKEESANSLFVRDIIVSDTNLFEWKFTILPSNAPFNVAAFNIEMKFPSKGFLWMIFKKQIIVTFLFFILKKLNIHLNHQH